MSARGTFLLASDFEGIKVRLRDSEGKYLATAPNGWTFCSDRARASVFDYVADKVEEYLKSVARVRGLVLKATPVEPKEILETCDMCHEMMAPAEAFFDGRRFVCPDCRRKASTRRLRSAI